MVVFIRHDRRQQTMDDGDKKDGVGSQSRMSPARLAPTAIGLSAGENQSRLNNRQLLTLTQNQVVK